MKRRVFVLATGATALGTALVVPHALGQPAMQPRRVGLLTPSDEASFAGLVQAVRDGLREHGHVAGRDIVIDIRYAGGRAQELPRLAAELAALKPAVIIALGPSATDAALAATTDTPIVSLGDLVASGHAAQLGRPGGRVTGVSFLPAPLNAKRLELLAELLQGQRGAQSRRPQPPTRRHADGRRRRAFARAGDACRVRKFAGRDRIGVHGRTQVAGGRSERAQLAFPACRARAHHPARGQRQTARDLPVAGEC